MLESSIMTNPERNWGGDRGIHLYEVSSSATRMITERINLRRIGLRPINLPLCTETEANQLEEFLPRAKEGFALAVKAHQLNRGEVPDFLDITTPFTIEGVWRQLRLQDRENTLPEYHQVLTTLNYLAQKKRVSFYSFVDIPNEVNPELGLEETFWNRSFDTAESLWTTMEELENSVRATLYQSHEIRYYDLLRVGHFFAASQEISSIFKNA